MKVLYSLASVATHKTGIGNYTQHLIAGMLGHSDITDVAGMQGASLIRGADLLKQPSHLPASSAVLRLKKYLRARLRFLPDAYQCRDFVQACLSRRLRMRCAEEGFIYHETSFIPAFYPGKLVISVHDLSHIRYPEYHPKERVNYLNRALPQALQRADKVITGSEFSRLELLDCFHIDPKKVVTVLDGVDEEFSPKQAKETQPVLDKYNLHYQKYMLSVCTIEPRKNLSRLLQAFSSLPQPLRRDYPMVLVGGKGWQTQQSLGLIEPLLAAGELIMTGYVPQSDLPYFYAGAKVFAYPSLYEGFGLPVLEAMASGVPVVTSNNTALPEVSGGAALEVNPLSVRDIAEALQYFLENEALVNRCIAQGLERAKLLTWDRCVEGTIAVYRALSNVELLLA